MKTFVIPGWGFNSKIFNKLKGEIVPIEWSDILDIEKRELFVSQLTADSLLICWSLAAFLMLPFINQIKSKSILLISAGASFTRAKLSPRGARKSIIDNMINDLNQDKTKCLNNFLKGSAYPLDSISLAIDDDYLQNSLATELLTEGLLFLREADFSETINSPEKITLLQGDKDTILHKSSAKLFAEKYQLKQIEIEGGGHLLPYTHSEVIQNWIDNQ